MAEGVRGRVLGVFSGPVRSMLVDGRVHQSAIRKDPVAGPVGVGPLGLPGDEHEFEAHGGMDQALSVYSADYYPMWRAEFDLDLPDAGAFGENLTLDGLADTDVFIGDTFRIGDVVAQITCPRSPCYKIGLLFGEEALPVRMQETNSAGYMLRVITEGHLQAGDEMVLIDRPQDAVSVAEAARVVSRDREDWPAVERVIAVPQLADAARQSLQVRLAARDGGEEAQRLFGEGEGEPAM